MKILTQTKLTPVMTIYDSTAPDTGAGSVVKDFLQPVISVQTDDGNVIYATGDFYESYFPIVAGVVGAVILGLIIRRAIR